MHVSDRKPVLANSERRHRATYSLPRICRKIAMAKLQNLLRRPRYLRAIPSLMLLTTAMAWGVSPDAEVRDDVQRRPAISVSQSHAPGPAMLPARRGHEHG